MNTQQTEEQHLIPLYGKRDISLVRGEGVFVYDEEGNEYFDLLNGHGAVILGYNNAAYTHALQEQAARLTTTHSSFYSKERAYFLEEWHKVLPEELSHSFISSTGTECTEAALKFARLHTGKHGVLYAKRAYHGRTMGTLSVNGTPKYRKGLEPLLEGSVAVAFNDIEAMREAYTEDIGAVILEPIQGEAGALAPSEEYLQQVREFCDEKGILLILDEVQASFRTGYWLACEQYGVVPDIVCVSKALGNGFPVAVTSVTAAVAQSIPKGVHGTTFGSNPLACRAARTTLELIEEMGLLARAQEMGAYFKEQLSAVDSDLVREVRVTGLFIGIDLKQKAGLYAKRLQEEHGILVGVTGVTLRLLPAMIIEKEHVDRFIAALKAVLT